MRYATTRDIKLLEDDYPEVLAECTVFHVKPLLAKYEHLDPDDNPRYVWTLFALHVERIENTGMDDEIERMFEERNGERSLKEEARELIAPVFVRDISKYLWEAASADGDKIPFSLPGTLLDDIRKASAVQSAMKPTPPAPTA